ncbi:hypothetical protein P154DRAFT_501467 [Amniculicola lignicola CBS 123094]|uniref:ATP synthase protein 8 n=1 Tax=Amniculicola lignicola CBS 123094 TaxID=1392246 RepID=A0A6A5W0B3_9PLEO|nr:hypothetical protein P154DRAFT_501467 [Amniculicola lignicola CBS 123094]
MNTARLFRPLARSAATFRQPLTRPSVLARPAVAAAQMEVQKKQSPFSMPVLRSAMPQLVPFFMVNETTFAFILLPTLIYVLSKYILPQRVRLMAARLFISKL